MRTLVALALLIGATACASPAKLARQSQVALSQGDLRTAYDKARRAVEKDPLNQEARAAYVAASRRVAEDYRSRVLATATGDTLAAADLALGYHNFQAEVTAHQSAIEPVPDYERAERAILAAAARFHFGRGNDAMASGHPKLAVAEYTTVGRYAPAYPDVVERLAEARNAATKRVALLPFANDIRVPGLSEDIADTVQREVARRAARELPFTQIVSTADVEQNLTVAEMRNPRPEDAVAIGRRVGAEWVVVGRFRGMRSTDSRRSGTIQIVHRVDRKDTTGVVHTTWEADQLPIATRRRDVTVQYEIDVIDVRTGRIIAHREPSTQAAARIVWTDYRPDENFERYALLPPDDRRRDPKRAQAADARWRQEVGAWDLGDFMRHSREQRDRSTYSARYRGEFYRDTRETPVWLGELPSESDMAFVALRDTWREVFALLRELDAAD